MARGREGIDRRALWVLGARLGQPRGKTRRREGLGGRGREGWLGDEKGFPGGTVSARREVRAAERASKVGRGPRT